MNVTHLSMLYRETKSEEIIHYNLLKNFHSCPKNGAILQRCHRRVSDTEKFQICKVKKVLRFKAKLSYSTILSMAILLLVCFNLLKQRQKIGHMYRLLSVIHKMCINHWMRDVPGI